MAQTPANLKPGKGKGYVAVALAPLLKATIRQINLQYDSVLKANEGEDKQRKLVY